MQDDDPAMKADYMIHVYLLVVEGGNNGENARGRRSEVTKFCHVTSIEILLDTEEPGYFAITTGLVSLTHINHQNSSANR